MPAQTTPRANTNVAVYDDGLECTPESLFKGLAGCFGFLITLIIIASLGIIAGGVFWTAQNMDRITDANHAVQMEITGFISS
jgi:hypothetical protein